MPRPTVLAVLALIALAFASGCKSTTAADRAAIADHKDYARIYLEGGQIEKAADQYSRVLALAPDDYESLLGLSFASAVIRQFEWGKTSIERAEAQHPEDPMVHLAKGMVYYEWGRADARQGVRLEEMATAYADPATPGADPSKARGFGEEAARYAASAQEKLATARAALVECERLYGDTREAVLPPVKGEPVEAASATQKRLADNGYLLSMLALAHVASGREHYRTAIRYLERYVATVAQIRADYKTWYEKERVKMSDAQQLEAKAGRESLERSERKARTFAAWLLYDLASYAQSATPPDKATEAACRKEATDHLVAVLELDPDSPTQLVNLARMQAQNGDIPAAIASLQKFNEQSLGRGDLLDVQLGAVHAIRKMSHALAGEGER